VARAEVAAQARVLALIDEVAQRQATGVGMSPWDLPIVVACRRVIADTILQLPLVAMRNRRPLPSQPAVCARPDPFEPRWLSMWRVADNLTGWGHVWLRPTAWDASTGWPNAVRVYDAPAGAPQFDPTTGDLVGVSIDGTLYRPGPQGVIWLPYDVPRRGHPGQSPISRCWQAVTYLAALYEMAGSFWEAGFPSVALQVGARLNDDDTRKLKAQLLSSWARRHEPAVIDNGATLAAVGSNAVDSQLVESIQVANAEVARAFGVMPSLVNVAAGDSLTYSTTEGEMTKWLSIGLGPYLTRIEAAFTDLLPYGQSAVADTAVLTRADFLTRAQAYTVALAGAPWLLVDEVRDREGLEPIEVAMAQIAAATGAGTVPPPPAVSPSAGDAIVVKAGPL